ncbi:uncharacterized protein LOC113469128 [Diaphorina citri]|uniref:Uncharacterized protein LOC113469128 n=1 Tax=Diaphorina citri TaxID=121845 RepID=A0A3Q0J1Q4_DIACI|nr:uncharacterized protein LOC113469128 [Diaphorina citri]
MSHIKEHVKYRKKHLDRIAQTMLNNKELCDVTFVINKKQYHACRSMMTVTSQVFATLLKEHFENTTDEKLVLQGIKHEESFYNMLCYIHGVDIDLTAMSKVVLCELLHLADRYKLTELHADLKIYISKLRRFKINSIVTLLNTSKTHDLSYLYDRLKTYVYQHMELFIKHETFVDLNYDVLVDLLQSDWFCAAEIDLLKATLTWHDKNIMYTRKQEQIDNDYEVKNDHAGDTQGESNLNEDCCSNSSKADDSWTEIYPIEGFLNKYSDDLFIFDDSDKESTNMSFDKVNDKLVVHELSSQESTDHSNNSEINYPNETADRSEDGNIPDKTNKSEAKVVEIVSGNILKTLLVQIRFSRIPMFDFQKALKTDELIPKFKDDIMELINSSELNNEPRNIYTGFTKILKVKITRKKLNANVPFYSKRFYIKNQPWAICAYYNDEGYCIVSLEHYSNLKLRWESDVVYQLTMISHKPFVEDMHAHNFNNDDDDECYELHTFDHSEDNCFILHDLTDVSTFLDDDNGFMQNDTITFELHIIKFDFKCLCHVCQDETETNEGQGSSEHINSPDHKVSLNSV